MTQPLAAVAYLRVSTQGQAEDGNGLALQESACRDHATLAGLDLIGVITERGVSGDRAERPALAQALAMIKSGDADAILVYRLDRLARDLVLQEILLKEITAAGGQLLSATAGENESHPSRESAFLPCGPISADSVPLPEPHGGAG